MSSCPLASESSCPRTMLPLLALLPLALAANLPAHHQQLVDKYGVENVNFDANVSISLSLPVTLPS